MKLIKDQTFGGERPLFASHDVHLDNVTITAGESAIKECSNIVATNCRFEGNYPFWHVHGFTIQDCYFAVGGRSALWYSDHLVMKDTVIDAPKMFREMNDIEIENVQMNDADEIFWRCDRLNIRNLTLHDGTYPFMFSRNIYVDGLVSDSKYVFQYVKDVEIHHAKITTKDAFWEVENVTIYDSELNGEYLGWHSKNLRRKDLASHLGVFLEHLVASLKLFRPKMTISCSRQCQSPILQKLELHLRALISLHQISDKT